MVVRARMGPIFVGSMVELDVVPQPAITHVLRYAFVFPSFVGYFLEQYHALPGAPRLYWHC